MKCVHAGVAVCVRNSDAVQGGMRVCVRMCSRDHAAHDFPIHRPSTLYRHCHHRHCYYHTTATITTAAAATAAAAAHAVKIPTIEAKDRLFFDARPIEMLPAEGNYKRMLPPILHGKFLFRASSDATVTSVAAYAQFEKERDAHRPQQHTNVEGGGERRRLRKSSGKEKETKHRRASSSSTPNKVGGVDDAKGRRPLYTHAIVYLGSHNLSHNAWGKCLC